MSERTVDPHEPTEEDLALYRGKLAEVKAGVEIDDAIRTPEGARARLHDLGRRLAAIKPEFDLRGDLRNVRTVSVPFARVPIGNITLTVQAGYPPVLEADPAPGYMRSELMLMTPAGIQELLYTATIPVPTEHQGYVELSNLTHDVADLERFANDQPHANAA